MILTVPEKKNNGIIIGVMISLNGVLNSQF